MGFNAKLFEVLVYPESFNVGLLNGILDNGAIRHYAYALHDKDENRKPHYHIALRMYDTRNSGHVAKWFGIKDNMITKVKGRWADMLSYLVHQNAPEKYQYDPEIVVSNFEWQKEAEKAVNNNSRIGEILDGIASGLIREFNYTDHITLQEYSRWETNIKRGFKYRIDTIKRENRNMKCFFINGDSGVGKTTYAKDIAESHGYSVYVSSGSNDVLDDYQGQDCLILDDLRPSCMGLSDLLKLLDPHTASSVKSRYKNKVLECKLIIITTTRDIETFFHELFEKEEETMVQLMRRCQMYITMAVKEIYIRVWQPESRMYAKPVIIPNRVLAKFQMADKSPEEQLEFIAEGLGIASDALKEMVKEQSKGGKTNVEQITDYIKSELGGIVVNDK